MKQLLCTLLAAALFSLTGYAQEDGFTNLFNGKDLTGWEYGPVPVAKKPTIEKLDGKTTTKDQVFQVEKGMIVASGKRIMAIYTDKEYNKDFIFKLEFRNAAEKPKDNSGIYIRGPQLQLDAVTEGGLTGVFRKANQVQSWRLERDRDHGERHASRLQVQRRDDRQGHEGAGQGNHRLAIRIWSL
jgi:hypothetical protein